MSSFCFCRWRTCLRDFALLTGMPTTFTRSMDTIVDDIKVAKLHWFASVSRVYEKVYAKVLSGAAPLSPTIGKFFHAAGILYSLRVIL